MGSEIRLDGDIWLDAASDPDSQILLPGISLYMHLVHGFIPYHHLSRCQAVSGRRDVRLYQASSVEMSVWRDVRLYQHAFSNQF